jgi:hypothetical protein
VRLLLGVLCAFLITPFVLLGLWMLAVEIVTRINQRRQEGHRG